MTYKHCPMQGGSCGANCVWFIEDTCAVTLLGKVAKEMLAPERDSLDTTFDEHFAKFEKGKKLPFKGRSTDG